MREGARSMSPGRYIQFTPYTFKNPIEKIKGYIKYE